MCRKICWFRFDTRALSSTMAAIYSLGFLQGEGMRGGDSLAPLKTEGQVPPEDGSCPPPENRASRHSWPPHIRGADDPGTGCPDFLLSLHPICVSCFPAPGSRAQLRRHASLLSLLPSICPSPSQNCPYCTSSSSPNWSLGPLLSISPSLNILGSNFSTTHCPHDNWSSLEPDVQAQL